MGRGVALSVDLRDGTDTSDEAKDKADRVTAEAQLVDTDTHSLA